MLGRYFEDLRENERFQTAGVTVTEDSIIRFALEWDPQPFHVDKEAAKDSLFGSLISSGYQTLLLSYRLYYDLGILSGTALAGLGFDDVRFLKPVRPGDTLRVNVTVVALRPSSKSDRGIVTMALETVNQRGEALVSMTMSALVARRPSEYHT